MILEDLVPVKFFWQTYGDPQAGHERGLGAGKNEKPFPAAGMAMAFIWEHPCRNYVNLPMVLKFGCLLESLGVL